MQADGQSARHLKRAGGWHFIDCVSGHEREASMEIRQVKYFLAACEELSFTRAAKRCNVAQPSLSVALQRLERELGGQLFVRASTGVHLTRLGRAVMPHFEQINRHVERARKIASGAVTTVNGMRRGRADNRLAGYPSARDRDRARERPHRSL
jgi:DNA-binding transcriptional LysR family regulator